MLRNEYGAIQQHLEPQHVRDLLVPIPEDNKTLERLIEPVRRSIETRELLEQYHEQTLLGFNATVSDAIAVRAKGE